MNNTPSTDLVHLIQSLEELGINLWLEGDELRLGGDSSQLTEELIGTLRKHKAEIMATLRQDSEQPAVLSFAQQRLWFLEKIPHEAGVYHVPVAIRIEGQLDIRALQTALTNVIERHQVLRTCFPAPAGEPVAEVMPVAAPDLTPVVLAESPNQVELEQNLLEQAAQTFDLTREAPLRIRLYRTSANEHVLSLVLHHIACDGWSMDILIQELAAGYRSALLGSAPQLPSLDNQYADFARWQRNRLRGNLLETQLSFWRERLQQPPVLELPTDFPRPKIQQHEGAVVQFDLPASLVEPLREMGNQHSATLFMTLLSAFKVLLSRYSGQWDVVVGTPVSNRQNKQFEGLIGLFVNTLVLRTPINPHGTFSTLLQQVRQTTLDALAHQDLPFEQLIDVLKPERDMSRNPVFQVKFRLENAGPTEFGLPGLTLRQLPQNLIKAKLDLSMDLYETDQGIVGGLEYNTSLFKADTIERMAEHFKTLLKAIVQQPKTELQALPLLSVEQQRQQLQEWNDTQKPFEENTCFHHLVENVAAQQPQDIALVFDDGQQQQTLTYAEMNARANQLAHWLMDQGVGQDVVVGICMDRSIDMIVALLAVMKAGAAYLPLDANYPEDRIRYMLDNAAVPVLLSHSQIPLPALPETTLRTNLDQDWPSAYPQINPQPQATPSNLAYVIYTSGSTGLPKGVMIEHQGLVNLTEDKLRVCDVRSGDCVLQFFSFSFDASIPEIIMPLAIGGRLLLAPAVMMLPGPDLRDLMLRQKVSHITMTPSALVSLPEADYPDLRMVLVGGEAPAPDLIQKWSRNRRFINAYGPTETTVNASMVPCGNGAPLTPTLLPSTNKQLYVLDEHLQLLPVGAIGKLYIGGVGLARGYLKRPDLTAKAFIPNPFHARNSTDNGSTEKGSSDKSNTATSELLYDTGDLAYFQNDGRIRLVGRADHQVKIRGYRVEPGDVEHCLSSHPQVEAAVVIAIDDAHQGKRLAGFAVQRVNQTANAERPSSAAMRQYVGEQLPAYMVPSSFHWLNTLPLTPNGKIDNRALQRQAQIPDADVRQVPPRNESEHIIAGLFSDILGNPNIGADTDFFEAGGHSLLATQLVAKLLDRFAVEINVMDLFEAPTVAGLAQRIEHKLKLARLQTPQAESVEETEEIEL